MPDEPRTNNKDLTTEEAVAFLPVKGKTIHTYRQAGASVHGRNWDREELLELMSICPLCLSGPLATQSGHGIVLQDDTGYMFIETRADAAEVLAAARDREREAGSEGKADEQP